MGAVLSAAREQQSLTIDDVCTRLRISPRQVRALESDDFSALPEATITRGFIRNYARLLGIDAEPLLQSYRASAPSKAPPALTLASENILISGKDSQPWLKYILASILIALLVGAWQLYMDYMPKPVTAEMPAKNTDADHDAAQEVAGEAATTEPLPMPALPAAERASGETVLPEGVPAAPSVDAQTPAAVTPEAVTQQPVVATKAAAKLQLSFTGKSWVNVTDKDKKIIFDRIMTAGSEAAIEGQPPLTVVIGNAPVSKLTFNDKPVDLALYTKVDVARVTLE